jgi:hypothetical protein
MGVPQPGGTQKGKSHLVDAASLISAMLACLAATAALRPPATFRASLDRVQRSRHVVAQYEAPTLPVGWISALDQESGLAYYCEEASGECQWELPQPGAAALQEYAQTLPAGWISAVDQESGATYYFHEQTGISQWELPAHEIRVGRAGRACSAGVARRLYPWMGSAVRRQVQGTYTA